MERCSHAAERYSLIIVLFETIPVKRLNAESATSVLVVTGGGCRHVTATGVVGCQQQHKSLHEEITLLLR